MRKLKLTAMIGGLLGLPLALYQVSHAIASMRSFDIVDKVLLTAIVGMMCARWFVEELLKLVEYIDAK